MQMALSLRLRMYIFLGKDEKGAYRLFLSGVPINQLTPDSTRFLRGRQFPKSVQDMMDPEQSVDLEMAEFGLDELKKYYKNENE